MVARIIVNLVVMGSGILSRSFVQAYRQAITNASKSGVAQEAIQNTIRKGGMTEKEARLILGVHERSPLEEIMKKYNALFENNHKNGSFYLQSKVQRAKEFLEKLHQGKVEGTIG
ncbi:Mitochondrial import inner membrane translocase subunit pam16 like [Thalictrum thalictroides]|uniref:Mitochondrial import inner membrane translocase subunit pam16 like n=1 Tax=Thalictrum thalictroides TaxID=46969 RepID=A0A7J6VM40_THATH|nr:Mitochondrial import inner membrane translocase subunit pam16 like [Thalictrum thalictroides]